MMPHTEAGSPRYRMVTAERGVGLVALPPGCSRKLVAAAGEFSYVHATGAPAWAPKEIVRFEDEQRRRTALARAAPH
eukprot:4025680-Alexandrium_andersonii.AAC.1